MAQAVGKYAANKFLKKHMKGYANKKVDSGDDPYFAMVEDPRRPGKFKKVKKQIPAYVPEHDAMVLASVRKNAYRLDMSLFNFMGIRFGWEAVIGIVPGFGDAVGVALAMLIYRKACKVDGGLDSTIKLRMLINIVLDFVVGLVPFIGDVADAAFKANTRNARLLEVYLDKKYKPRGNGEDDERRFAGVDKEKRRQNRKSGIYHPQDPPPATVFEDFSDEDEERRQFIRDQESGRTDDVRRPESAASRDDRRGKGGWFSGGGGGGKKSRRQGDHGHHRDELEMSSAQETGRTHR